LQEVAPTGVRSLLPAALALLNCAADNAIAAERSIPHKGRDPGHRSSGHLRELHRIGGLLAEGGQIRAE
jgi:hypothetical protein